MIQDPWKLYATIAVTFASWLWIALKLMKGSPSSVMLCVLAPVTGLFAVQVFFVDKTFSFHIGFTNCLILLSAAIASWGVNYYSMKAIQACPNPSYFLAVFESRLVIVFFLSLLIFGTQTLSLKSVVGVTLVLIGAILV